MQSSFIFRCATLLLCLACFSCNGDKNTSPHPISTAAYTYHQITPVDFPNLNINGFSFPQDSNVMNGWIRNYDKDKNNLYLHAWGIWTGITSPTTQQIGGDTLKVFETWLTPGEIVTAMNTSDANALTRGSKLRSNRANLRVPRQLDHPGIGILANVSDKEIVTDFESVAYSPAAAQFAYDNKVFSAVQLAQYQDKMREIPFFPNTAITIKPLYKILNAASGKTRFYIPVWPPSPASGYPDKLKGYGEETWKDSVEIDITNQARDPQKGIFGLNDFIAYKLNQEDIDYFVKQGSEGVQIDSSLLKNTKPGDIAILVAMHVTSREINNWTWQTFWWASDPDNPPSPSSKEIADARPAQLTGAARHYAMAIAYYMVNPNEPYAGDVDMIGQPNYAFNPYLEATFSSLGPGISHVNTAVNAKSAQIAVTPTYVGIRSNCMSCHRMAAVNLNNPNLPTPGYVGNTYISQSNPLLNNMLLLDFAWSIQGNIDTTGFSDYLRQKVKSSK
jgi:hypothetical protein